MHKFPPLLHLFLPFLLGTSLPLFFSQSIPHFFIPTLILFALTTLSTIHTYLLTKKKHTSSQPITLPFRISSSVLFLLFGCILMTHSVRKAQKTYSDEWRFSVYYESPFTTSSSKALQLSLHNLLTEHGISGQRGAIIEAMTIGYKKGITKETKDNFSRCGVSHVLALSGFHVGIIFMILQIAFLYYIRGTKPKKYAQLLCILILWVYAFISGMSPSIVRAVLMCSIFCMTSFRGADVISFNGLILSAFILICLQPLVLIHAGFQLSYLSMLGIYLIGIPMCKAYTPYCFIDKFLWCTTCLTICCTLFTLPVTSHLFKTIPLMSIPANIIVTTLTYIIFALFLLFIISFGAPPITEALLSLSDITNQVTTHIASIPYSTIDYQFSLPGILLYYSLLGILLILFVKHPFTTFTTT